MGVGMVAVVAASAADTAVELLTAAGVSAWACGEVLGGAGTVTLTAPGRGVAGAPGCSGDLRCERSGVVQLGRTIYPKRRGRSSSARDRDGSRDRFVGVQVWGSPTAWPERST